jgi:hypothetical protein
LASPNLSFQSLEPQQPRPAFILEGKAIVGRMIVGDTKSKSGILEIQLALSEFIQFLGAYQTIQLKEPTQSTLPIHENRFPFQLAKINPLPFQNYAYSLILHNWIFTIYISACLLILGVSLLGYQPYIYPSRIIYEKDFINTSTNLQEC